MVKVLQLLKNEHELMLDLLHNLFRHPCRPFPAARRVVLVEQISYSLHHVARTNPRLEAHLLRVLQPLLELRQDHRVSRHFLRPDGF